MYLNTGTLFGSELDIDYVKVSTSLTSPQITTNYATVANSISVPQMNTNYVYSEHFDEFTICRLFESSHFTSLQLWEYIDEYLRR